jgi:hypothetical protein
MSDPGNKQRADGELVRALVAASRAEHPPRGARERAFGAAARELGAGALATDAGVSVAARRRWAGRRVALAGLALAFGLLAGGLFVEHEQELRIRAAQADVERRLVEADEDLARAERVIRALNESKDPEKIAALQAELAEAEKAASLAKPAQSALGASGRHGAPSAAGGSVGTPAGAPRAGKPSAAACNCAPGDPLCSCL